ncbi:hypothetical protein M409DRAFT_28957 [Zasmidium cellare ATCC 36951]|uniref:F-box domain-containing protein n=1 Tax=Zasmidium cellare ATCC 36951 TaxID=1080233 RepID=A0A6A6C3Y8_ZASCE|nr:uncharacterized protein M409DRAFT_28957 [Zasmidium cellare ATCC 36951]KAF2160572.1 hypothetical protein M409DRAFT_28957 [Zasmidium cellare ATCC 36951]
MDETPRACLLGLPAELRLTVFEWALADSHVNLRHQRKRPTEDIRNPWAYLQINSQIRQEVLPIFYETVAFKLQDGMTEPKLQSWLEFIGPEATARIKKVEFNCKGRCAMFGLQPDTDYCHREVCLDLTTTRPANDVELLNAAVDSFKEDHRSLLCSNDAISCWDDTWKNARRQVGFWMRTSDGTIDAALITQLLLTMFHVLEIDHSTSAA